MARMNETERDRGLPPRRSDAEIAAAVGADPDQAPVRTRAAMARARHDEAQRDIYGVLRLRRRLRIGQIEFANRYGLALGTLRNWEQGRAEPDRSAKVLLAAIASDPDGVARAATHAGDPSYLAAGPRQAA
jgi:putative transcriptional regulator